MQHSRPDPTGRGQAPLSSCFIEALEARQLLSGGGMYTAGARMPTVGAHPALKQAVASISLVKKTHAASAPSAALIPATPPALFPAAVSYPAGSGNYSTGRNGTNWIVIHTTESTASS